MIGVGDRVNMMENTWYSVISPESCSSILWRSWEFKEKAADALKLTATDMKKLGIVDSIIKEPSNGAHRCHNDAFKAVKRTIKKQLKELKEVEPSQRINDRIDAFSKRGVWE